ncbi:MAG: citrate lyase holo-[acyl-carrier protein] synthase [Bacilli bacterium]
MKILNAREERAAFIGALSRKGAVIAGTANIPGPDKNTGAARFIVDYFGKLCAERFPKGRVTNRESADGPFFIIEIAPGARLKEELVKIENGHPLGRLVDLDLYIAGKPVSRRDLGLRPRACLLCPREAALCARSRAHDYRDISEKMSETVFSFLKTAVAENIDFAITTEASLDPKFGLVTPSSSGSHPDMDYQLMMKAKEAIIEPLLEIFASGYYREAGEALTAARAAGLRAEETMYEATGGVNAYKGLIFILGFVLLALGSCFREFSFDLFEKIKYFGADLLSEFTDTATFGKLAYRRYGITGARGEARSGLPNVVKVLPLLRDYSPASLTEALAFLIANCDDTVLLKRAGGLREYLRYRRMFANFGSYDPEKARALTDYCVSRNLSFGGAADLLVAALFIKKTEEKFKYCYER